jgi:hypothetical protein
MTTYVQIGLARRSTFGKTTVKDWEDNRDQCEADARDYGLTVDIALRQRILGQRSTAQPIDPNQIEKRFGGSTPIPSRDKPQLLVHAPRCCLHASVSKASDGEATGNKLSRLRGFPRRPGPSPNV